VWLLLWLEYARFVSQSMLGLYGWWGEGPGREGTTVQSNMCTYWEGVKGMDEQ
jgi:hypothetical protein